MQCIHRSFLGHVTEGTSAQGHCRDLPRKEDVHVKAGLKIDGRLDCADSYFRFTGNAVINEGLVPSITMPLVQAQGHLSGTGGCRDSFTMKNYKR